MPKILSALLLSALTLAAADHPPLLPKPRQVTYGAGRLRLSGLEIGFASNPTVEDRFAAAELSAALTAVINTPIPVRDGVPAGRAIVLKTTGPVGALPEKDEKPGPDGRESYRIKITEKGAEVTAPSSAGLFYAVQTLRQMVEGRSIQAALPEAEIHDWPFFSYRGFMMDLGHGSVLREEEIRRQIDLLARFKANQYYFYSEGTIELKGYSLLNRKGRYSQQQVHRIIEYARERHVDVVPCVEYYGHLHDLFRIERYADMAALPHGGDLNPTHPKAEALLKDWIAQTAALFPSPWFHVGLDEPFELEAAGSQAAGGIEPAELYRRHLDKVTRMVMAHGKRVLFWADIDAGARIFNKYPDLVEKLPADVVPVPWFYSARPDYTKWVEPFSKAHKPQVIAPGISCYNEIFPDYTNTFANIDGFIAAGRKHGAIGVINTGWTDDAQTIYRASMPGIAFGAAASWQSDSIDRGAFFSVYSGIMYPAPIAAEVAPALTALTESRDLLDQAIDKSTMHAFWDDALTAASIEQATAHREQLRKSRLRAEDALEHLESAIGLAPGEPTLPSLRLAGEMLDYLGMKRLYGIDFADYFRRAGPTPGSKEVWLFLELESVSQDHSHAADLMDAITSLKQDYAQCWRQEWTDYRFGTALGRWDAEYEYWRSFQAKVQDMASHLKEGDQVPPLEFFRPKQ